ncbi:deoxynucleoside triphosphate triphosphohydrolase SAMHD1 isoform X2 [Dicentrarchus labrax]|uniref:deoxynucleoside triphosphate triphosphohydrolase SAMHD1 isoform X2 n=1 Tax=Dicentrarchus labrax TaxID=13489 RepID=UPI0021F6312C|nr:deoxynucleoside triphosphate triphosphohydrolase SAMHD1 isoform X2 [Dicentrarchus labrax]
MVYVTDDNLDQTGRALLDTDTTSDRLKTPKKRMPAKLPLDFKKWTVNKIVQYLEQEELGRWADKFKEKHITGDQLQTLTAANLEDMGIKKPNDRERILLCIRKLWKVQVKVFNDPIHGHMELHPLLVKIIDTPQFQRLRSIRQLGGTYFVYPGASHNRFEHSIGVAHLAGQLGQALKTKQPGLNITDRDILCVQIAGLCHDLGHGPFSHLYDGMFIPKARPGNKWKHETASLAMFDHLVKCNKLEDVMKQYGLNLSEDLDFIKEMIDRDNDKDQEWLHKGRPKDKSFLYEIVSNKTNGIDVDKFDYFARDCYHLGVQINFDYHRFLKFARVCEVDGWKHICVRDKEEDNMTEMFHTRLCLHRRAYQHKVTKIIETMITDAFLKADKHIKIEGTGKKTFRLSTAIDDMEAYTKLTDAVFEKILNCAFDAPQELRDARDILRRIINRDLYRFLGETRFEDPTEEIIPAWKRELAEALGDGLTEDDFEIVTIKMDYGMKREDPIDHLYFYTKHDTTRAFNRKRCQVSRIRPMCFSEQLVGFVCKKTDDRNPQADVDNFQQWCRAKDFPEYQDDNN